MLAAIRDGELSGVFGRRIARFEEAFATYCGAKFGVACTSGTTALQLACRAAGFGPGDEVLVSSCTNIASALGIYYTGAVPVGVDSEEETWNLDLDLLETLVTDRTKGVLPVHFLGHPVDMDRLMAFCDERGLTVIEDAAEAHGAKVRGRRVGSFGHMACFSFLANKAMTTGEGGMVVTSDAGFAEKCRYLRNLAFGEPRFLHREAGYNFRMTGFQAAMGLVQLGRLESFNAAKRRLREWYREGLAGIPGLRIMPEASWAEAAFWMIGFVVDEDAYGRTRDELLEHLGKSGIGSRTFFCPMNDQPFLRAQEGFRETPVEVARNLWRRGFYLPSTCSLERGTIDGICRLIREFSR